MFWLGLYFTQKGVVVNGTGPVSLRLAGPVFTASELAAAIKPAYAACL